MKDYYKILGLAPNASQEEIKQAFKKLAKKYHPDANKGKKDAEERFKEISEAYDILGKPDSRQTYDMQREAEKFGGFSQENSFGFQEGISENIEDILRRFSGGFESSWKAFGKKYNASSRGFGDIFGQFGEESSSATLKVPLKIACNGGVINVSGLPGGMQRVHIPPNTRNGTLISLSTPSGPFRLEIALENDPPFFIKGNLIETVLKINLAQAVLGGKVKFRDPRDEEIILTIPPGSQPGDILKLRGIGIGKGDLHVRLEVVIPKHLSDEEKELFKAFANASGLKY